MKNTTLIQLVALAIMGFLISAVAEPKRSAQTKFNQPPVTKTQTVTSFDATTSQERRTPAQTRPARNESEIIKQTRAYEASLRDLAEKAQQIVQRMPERPDELAHNFGDLREVLVAARTNLTALLKRKTQIDAQAESVLQSAADLRQSFADLSKKIETHLQGLRQKETDNPKGLEAAAKAMSGIREACLRGQSAIGPLRQLVFETHQQGQIIFAELEVYPQIFDFAIEACDLYEKGIGEPTSYASVVEGLTKARANLRSIIETFIQAAQKADETIKKLPQLGTTPPIP
jgi:translation initiation factor 2B subunit (eIF-2B alpha/beta/delta family)